MEQFGISILEKHGYKDLVHVSKDKPQADFDIGNVAMDLRVDVKYAFPTMVSSKKRVRLWDFDLRKGGRKKPRITELDYYLCIGIVRNKPIRAFLVPWSEAPKCHLRISIYGKSKWNQYIIWEKL